MKGRKREVDNMRLNMNGYEVDMKWICFQVMVFDG